jgi:tetratricopeptide (TPR) repeat protein/SAM-dependent methyltransferase
MESAKDDPCSCGSGRKYKDCCDGKVVTLAAMPQPPEIDPLLALYSAGRFAELEERARELTGQYPEFGFGWKLLGGALQMQRRNALPAFRKAAELMPDDADAHYNLGIAQKSLGLLADAAASYRRALKIKADYAEAHSNLGNVLKELGHLKEAAASYRRTVELKPRSAQAHFNLGKTLKELGKPEEAKKSLLHAIAIKPDYVDALNNLAKILMGHGDMSAALKFVVRSLQIEDRWETKGLFVACVMRLNFTRDDGAVRNLLIRAISEPWCTPVELGSACMNIVRLNSNVGECLARAASAWPQRLAEQALYGSGGITAVSHDALLRRYLETAQVCDLDMERFLTMVRYTLLVAAEGPESSVQTIAESVLDFYGALARQCFINEYVFAWTDAETDQAHRLRDALVSALESEARIPVLWPLAAACYFPLATVPFAERLLLRSWPAAVDAVLTQQIREPEEERQYRATLPRLTDIDDEVSLLVQSQYEENPYPRWIKLTPANSPGDFNDILRRLFPLSSFRPLGKDGALEILVAGGGTGQHPIGTSRRFIGAQVLAIDLSLTSLGYAKRKSVELGLTNIEYAQADIMRLGAIERRFDVIESVGVLHHLGDPLAGWRVLLSLLRPGGCMKIGLYSEVARRGFKVAQTFISEHGYGSTADDIRKCRQEMIDVDNGKSFGYILKSGDFFSTSTCRDLLFHVQEHLMTIADIDAFIRENDLQFLGFEDDPNMIRAYRSRFPEDRAATNLTNWQKFENENPDTFIGMYQFWVQKRG